MSLDLVYLRQLRKVFRKKIENFPFLKFLFYSLKYFEFSISQDDRREHRPLREMEFSINNISEGSLGLGVEPGEFRLCSGYVNLKSDLFYPPPPPGGYNKFDKILPSPHLNSQCYSAVVG